MDTLTLRVAARFFVRVAEGEEDSAKGGVPSRWHEWLKATQQGGKKKVPNPNHETSKNYKEVSFSTALKDKGVFQNAMKDYKAWAKKNPEKKDEKSKGDSKPKEEKSEKKTPKSESKGESKPKKDFAPTGQLAVSDADLDTLIKKHKKAFDSTTKAIKQDVADYSKEYGKEDFHGEPVPKFAVEEFHSLSEPEKMIHVGGHKIGELFEKTLSKSEKEFHDIFVKGWTSSSSNPTSSQVQGALSSLGVGGHQTAKDKDKEMYREAGTRKDELKNYLGKAHAFTQAYMKHIGLKEMTLYRGVVDPAVEKAKEGEEVSMETRELSSFTSDPKVAARFGRPVKMKVPAKNILWSNMTSPSLSGKSPPGIGEAEVAVMGASDIVGKTIGTAGKLFDLEGR